MYDTVKLWQSSDQLNRGYLNWMPTILSDVSLHQKQNGVEYLTGKLDNLNISVSVAGFSLNGSLNKFWHKDNFKKITRQEVKHCVEMLEDLLRVELRTAEVKRFDIAHNFLMESPTKDYYHLLGESSRYNRLSQANSVYYNNSLRTKLFYDKIMEGKAKGYEIPQIWQQKNVLRYELRFTGRLPAQFNKENVIIKDLFDEEFYISSIDYWIKEYMEIKKNKLLMPSVIHMTSKDAKDYLLSALIEMLGHNQVTTIADAWKPNFTTPKEAQRFKNSLKNLKDLNAESPLMAELDKKILKVKEYYR